MGEYKINCIVEEGTKIAHIAQENEKNPTTMCCYRYVNPEIKATSLYNLPKDVILCKKCIATMHKQLKYYREVAKSLYPVVHAYGSIFKRCREHNPINENGIRPVRKCGGYDFISKEPRDVVVYLNKALENLDLENRRLYKNPIKCLDVGCGAGNVMALMEEVFGRNQGHNCIVHGIEFDSYYADLAEKLVTFREKSIEGKRVRVFCQDAFSFKQYDEYDIIYYWCPIGNDSDQKKLEILIEKNMKVGAILIPLLKKDKGIEKSKAFEEIKTPPKEFPIYRKVR